MTGWTDAAAPSGGTVLGLIEERALAVRNMSGPLPSPCISICQMDARSGLCLGCFRNIDEICAWSGMAEGAKRAVWQRIEQRCRVAEQGPGS